MSQLIMSDSPKIKQKSPSYQDWIDWMQEKDKDGNLYPSRQIPPMTRNQWTFAEFLLNNHGEISKIGNMETIFENVRKFLKS